MRPHTIGELCIDGDRACTQGDLATLRDIALRLAERLPEPMHCELVELRDACLGAPARAVALWNELKARLFRPEPASAADRQDGSMYRPVLTVSRSRRPAPGARRAR